MIARSCPLVALVLLGGCQTQPESGLPCAATEPFCVGDFQAVLLGDECRCFRPFQLPDEGLIGPDAGPVDSGGPDMGPLDVPVRLALGESHSCVVLSGGDVFCWGNNMQGQLGTGQETSDPVTTATRVQGLPPGVVDAAVGATASCARTDREVYCWGSQEPPFSQPGLLGMADVTTSPRAARVDATFPGVFGLTAGAQHACAIVGEDRRLRCWGRNDQGQLGLGDQADRVTPTPVPGLSGVEEVCAGGQHTCARLADGTVRCWGQENEGRLGNGQSPAVPSFQASPIVVPGLSGVVVLACGNRHTCALTGDAGDRQTWCWGPNEFGELGNDQTTTPVVSPRRLTSPVASRVDRLALGGRDSGFLGAQSSGFSCGVGDDLALHCWGVNDRGQLGIGATNPRSTEVPQAVATLGPALVDVAAGAGHACAIEDDGGRRRVLCWGLGDQGRLGNADSTDQESPVEVRDLP
ncbi:MAG: RCC1 domain-containing protein [Sandaracinaceae bacterium]